MRGGFALARSRGREGNTSDAMYGMHRMQHEVNVKGQERIGQRAPGNTDSLETDSPGAYILQEALICGTGSSWPTPVA